MSQNTMEAPTPGTNAQSLAVLKAKSKDLPAETELSFFTAGGLTLMQRAAMLLANSTLVPPQYRAKLDVKEYGKVVGTKDNPNALSNCVLALNMSQRLHADPLMIMQNLYIVEGRPGWSSQFIIAAINACGKFSPLRFKVENLGTKHVTWSTVEWQDNPNGGKRTRREIPHEADMSNFRCTAYAIEKASGEMLYGPAVDLEMAINEGWFGKNGSKWQTMPEVMLRYRAASFFGKLYAPELLMGLQTAEEVQDTIDLSDMQGDGQYGIEENTITMADIKADAQAPAAKPDTTPAGEPAEMAQPQEPEPAPEPAKPAAKPVARPAPQAAPKPAPAERPKPAAEPKAAPADPGTFRCPNGTDKAPVWVTESDCGRCNERQGCPQWGDGEEVF